MALSSLDLQEVRQCDISHSLCANSSAAFIIKNSLKLVLPTHVCDPLKSKSGNNLNFTPYQKNMIYHAPLQKREDAMQSLIKK